MDDGKLIKQIRQVLRDTPDLSSAINDSNPDGTKGNRKRLPEAAARKIMTKHGVDGVLIVSMLQLLCDKQPKAASDIAEKMKQYSTAKKGRETASMMQEEKDRSVEVEIG